MMDLKTYVTLDATDMAALIRKKETTPQELLELSFQQLEKVNPELNAITSARKEKVLEEAKKVNVENSPFSGVPLLLKNISQAVKGEPMTSGAKLLKAMTAEQDSYFVENLRERSEEHTSELQSRFDLVCRLLLEKKKKR